MGRRSNNLTLAVQYVNDTSLAGGWSFTNRCKQYSTQNCCSSTLMYLLPKMELLFSLTLWSVFLISLIRAAKSLYLEWFSFECGFHCGDQTTTIYNSISVHYSEDWLRWTSSTRNWMTWKKTNRWQKYLVQWVFPWWTYLHARQHLQGDPKKEQDNYHWIYCRSGCL